MISAQAKDLKGNEEEERGDEEEENKRTSGRRRVNIAKIAPPSPNDDPNTIAKENNEILIRSILALDPIFPVLDQYVVGIVFRLVVSFCYG